MAARKKVSSAKFIKLQEAKIQLERFGKGKPLLLLQGEETYEANSPFVAELAKKYEIIMPWAPGYGRSTLPDSITKPEDISYLYLDLLDQLKLKKVDILGCSMGGWLAAEMATKNSERIGKMVLIDPVGVKIRGKFDRDIEDIYYNTIERVEAMKWHDIAKDPRDLKALSMRAALAVARHRETTAKLCWNPYFHNPALKFRLNRITARTLVLWGANDKLVKPAYGRAYAKRIPKARFKTVAKAGHFPHIEQAAATLKEIRAFLR
jgi:pimeloyl-ACP methyl ester carboxylesterase